MSLFKTDQPFTIEYFVLCEFFLAIFLVFFFLFICYTGNPLQVVKLVSGLSVDICITIAIEKVSKICCSLAAFKV